MKKISIGSWAYTIGPYAENPASGEEVIQGGHKEEFHGHGSGRLAAAKAIVGSCDFLKKRRKSVYLLDRRSNACLGSCVCFNAADKK